MFPILQAVMKQLTCTRFYNVYIEILKRQIIILLLIVNKMLFYMIDICFLLFILILPRLVLEELGLGV